MMPISAAGAFVGFVLFAAFVFGLGIREFSRSDCDKFRYRRTSKSPGPLTNTVSTPRLQLKSLRSPAQTAGHLSYKNPPSPTARSYIFHKCRPEGRRYKLTLVCEELQPKSLRSPAQIRRTPELQEPAFANGAKLHLSQ